MIRLSRIISEKSLCEGEVIPRGWGYVRGGQYGLHFLIAPIPFNFVLGAWNWIEWPAFIGLGVKSDPLDGMRCYWTDRGRDKGYEEGYAAAFRHIKIAERKDAPEQR